MPAADAIVIGGGLAGMTVALAAADRGMRIALVSEARPGAASEASAGVLGPSIGRGPKGGRIGRFMFAARDAYPRYLEQLGARSGITVRTVSGALEIALNDTHFAELRTRSSRLVESQVLGASEVADLEPQLVRVAGAVFHPGDGAVDVPALFTALLAAISASPNVVRVDARAVSVMDATSDAPSVRLNDGSAASAPSIVLAAGAWVAGIERLPRTLPVRPVKGEVAVTRGAPCLLHVVFGAGGYLVPRADELLVGATSSEAGFEAEPTESAALELRATARALLRDQVDTGTTFASQRAGLRPMTPDGYPILGRDPDAPALVYACGYSRNGVLLSPLAGDCVAALIAGDEPGYDLTPFSASRFGG